MIERHLLKLRARDELSEAEEQAVRGAVAGYRDYDAGAVVIRAGEELDHSTLLLDGMGGRFKDLRDGQRQVTQLHVPGDFLDLHSFTLKRLDHDVIALTASKTAIVPHARLHQITQEFPHLTRLYWFGTNLDAAIHREWALSLGRRSAIARMAHLFCELQVRLEIVGLADAQGYALDLTQQELSELLGLSPVHVNRTLMELRRGGSVDLRSGRLTIHDLAELRAIGEFDSDYLYLEKRPR